MLQNIQIYYLKCDKLPDPNSIHQSVKVHALELPSYKVNNYLLEGSTLSYNICAVTNVTSKDTYQSTVYILDNLDEAESFDPKTTNAKADDFTVYHNADLMPTTSGCFHQGEYRVSHRGYYTIVIFPPPNSEVPHTDIKIWYSAEYLLKTIEADTLNKFEKCCCIYYKNDTCEIELDSPHTINDHCLVAAVEQSQTFSSDRREKYVHIFIEFSEWVPGKVAFYSLGGLACATAMCIAVVITLYACWHCRHR